MGTQVVVGAALLSDGRLLAAQRAHPADIAGMWELPGGRVEPDESERDAVRRELREELEVDVEPGVRVGDDVALRGGAVLRIYTVRLLRGEPRPVQHLALRWLTARDLGTVDWLPADRALLPALQLLLDEAA